MNTPDKPAEAQDKTQESKSQTELILGRPTGAAESEPGAASDQTQVAAPFRHRFQQLVQLRDSLIDREQSLTSQAQETIAKDRSQAGAESATTGNLRDMAYAQGSTYQDFLQEVNDAIERIKAGEYGVCQVTGQKIPDERLESLPWTRFSKEAEEDLEARGQAPVQFHLPEPDRLNRGSTAAQSQTPKSPSARPEKRFERPE